MNDQITDKMIERLLDAKAAVGHAEGIYTAGAIRELNEAIAAIKALASPAVAPPAPTTATVTDEMVKAAHKALMSELFVVCQPKWGDVFAFMDDHPEVLRPAVIAAMSARRNDMNAETELERAYRAIRGFWTAAQKGDLPHPTMIAYHSPTIAAACRFVETGNLDGSEYFVGKHFDVLNKQLEQRDPGRPVPKHGSGP